MPAADAGKFSRACGAKLSMKMFTPLSGLLAQECGVGLRAAVSPKRPAITLTE